MYKLRSSTLSVRKCMDCGKTFMGRFGVINHKKKTGHRVAFAKQLDLSPLSPVN